LREVSTGSRNPAEWGNAQTALKGANVLHTSVQPKGALLIFSAARRGHRGAGRTSVERQAGMGKRPSIARSPPLKSGAGPQGCAPRCAHPCGSMGCAQWSDA